VPGRGGPPTGAAKRDEPPKKLEAAECSDAETQKSNRQSALENEAAKQRSPSAEAQEPIRSHAGLSLEGMASNPSRVVGKCLPQLALIGVYPMAIALSTIKTMKNLNFELAV
jgi:hypothetical protein